MLDGKHCLFHDWSGPYRRESFRMGPSLPIPGIAVCDVITVCLLAGEDQAFAFGWRIWCEEGLEMLSLLLVGA